MLHILIHSLYTHREIFLRELVSNSSDALDKLKYLTLTDPAFKNIDFQPRIDIFIDQEKGRITVSDNGIGMDDRELMQDLGTIAGSGTRSFLDAMTGDAARDASLIGQFGVGFYSVFMVSEKVEVTSRKAGEEKAYKWISDGKQDYEIKEASRDESGTTVTCHLTGEGREFVSKQRIEHIVKKYSDHIPFPIYLHYRESTAGQQTEKAAEEQQEKDEEKVEQINRAAALWNRPKSELSEEDYQEFYRTLTHDDQDPLLYIHTRAEGPLQYTTLFFVPPRAPFDLFHSDFQPGVKLYVKRVFITDSERELLPSYLRFIRGIVDSEDLPLNVSRETLQHNRVLLNIRNLSVKKILGSLTELMKTDREKYEQFFDEFRKPLKEGLYQDADNRETLLDLMLYRSTEAGEGYTSLREYRDRMKQDQKSIYYLTGDDLETLKNSPLIEVYREKGYEVLLMDDQIDEIVIPAVVTYQGISFQPVNRADTGLESDDAQSQDKAGDLEPLLKRIGEILQEQVKDVRVSSRLSDSPSCVVADEADPTLQLQHILETMGHHTEVKPVLEINPRHDIIKHLAETKDDQLIEDVSWLLFEQALLIEGVRLKSPTSFAKRLNKVLSLATKK
jgi:molecular chaperone HtpG